MGDIDYYYIEITCKYCHYDGSLYVELNIVDEDILILAYTAANSASLIG